MKSKTIQFVILSLLLIGTVVAATSSVAAQRRNRWDGYPNWGGSYQLRETALNAGYNEGSKEGRNDRNRNRYRSASEFGAYQNATKDYSSRLGDRDLYRRYFQLAFERGYDTENPNNYRNDRYDRNDRNDRNDRDRDRNRNQNDRRGRNWDLYGQYGGSYQLRQTALNAGYNAGNKAGRDDRRKGRHRNYSDLSA